MAAKAAVVSPQKRRRVTQPAPERAVVEAGTIEAVHRVDAGNLVNVDGRLVFCHDYKKVVVKGQEKPVLSVVLSDGTSLIRVELWGPAAKAHVAQITAADEADGFAEVKLRAVEVGSSRNGGYLGMKLLQVLPTSEMLITGSTAEIDLAGLERAAIIATHFMPLAATSLPCCACIRAIIREVTDLTYTRNDIPQKSLVVQDEAQYGLKILVHGYWAQEPFIPGQCWLLCFLEIKGDRDRDGGTAWVFDTAYCVKMSDPDGDMDLGSLRETLTWG